MRYGGRAPCVRCGVTGNHAPACDMVRFARDTEKRLRFEAESRALMAEAERDALRAERDTLAWAVIAAHATAKLERDRDLGSTYFHGADVAMEAIEWALFPDGPPTGPREYDVHFHEDCWCDK